MLEYTHWPTVGAVLLAALIASPGCCYPKRELRLEKTSLPPVFKMSGGSSAYLFFVRGPYPDIPALRTHTGPKIIWELRVISQKISPDDLPSIPYGTVPAGFREEKGPAPALQTGGYYLAHAQLQDISPAAWGNDKGTKDICFRVDPTSVVLVAC